MQGMNKRREYQERLGIDPLCNTGLEKQKARVILAFCQTIGEVKSRS